MDVPSRQRMHPLVAAASVSVILVSMLGAAVLTGVLPTSTGLLLRDAPSLKAAPSAAPVAAPAVATTVGNAPTVVPSVSVPASALSDKPDASPAAAPAAAPAATSATPLPAAQSVSAANAAAPAGNATVKPVPLAENDQMPAAPAAPVESVASTAGASAVVQVASGAAVSTKSKSHARPRRPVVASVPEPVGAARVTPVYREPPGLGYEATPSAGATVSASANTDAAGANREVNPVEVPIVEVRPTPVIPPTPAAYPVVTPRYPANTGPSRVSRGADPSAAAPDLAGRARRSTMRRTLGDDVANQPVPQAPEPGQDAGTAARLGSVAGRSLGDTIDRTVAGIVGALGGNRAEQRPAQPRAGDAASEALYR